MEILLFVFFLIVFIGLLIGSYVVKSIRNFKKAVEQAADLRAQQMRNEVGRKNQQYSKRNTTTHNKRSNKANGAQEPYESSGVNEDYQQSETIIDHHQQRRESRKIFDDEEGEYVEFTEEK